MKDIILWGLVAYFLLQKGGSYAASKFSIGTPKLSYKGVNIGRQTISLGLSIPIKNSQPIPIPIDSIEGRIYLRGNEIGSFYNNTSINIAGSGETIYPVNFEVKALDGFSTILEEIKNSGFSVVYTPFRVEGKAISKGVVIPFSQSVSIA